MTAFRVIEDQAGFLKKVSQLPTRYRDRIRATGEMLIKIADGKK
jgi:hypothetical protein